jgi:hypothetical protein
MNIHLSYNIKVTNWDDHVTVSNVSLHKKGTNMHFLSEQANIYMDEKEIVVVVPSQKMLFINAAAQEINSHRISDEFFEMRRAFLDCCIVVKCESKTPESKILVLRVDPKKVDENVHIKSMTYNYNPVAEVINSVKINYDEEYKVKQLVITYKELNTESNYKFSPAKDYIVDWRGHIRDKYRSYEIVDNRDQKTKSKSR